MIRILHGDCRDLLRTLDAGSCQTCVTSPPYYGLRDYGVDGQIGLEPTPDAYVAELVGVFREVRRALRDDGTVWLNLGDSYCSTDKWGGGKSGNSGKHTVASNGEVPSWAKRERRPHIDGIKPKDLLGIPWRVAFALQADGWYLRSAIVWAKPNPMPESVTDRPTSSYEMVFMLAKSARYFYDAEGVKEQAEQPDRVRRDFVGGSSHLQRQQHSLGGVFQGSTTRNARNVWTIATQPYSGAHFATMPPDLAERCIKAGSKPGDTVLDPFGGAGTTGLVADRLNRHAILVELNPGSNGLSVDRIVGDSPLFAQVVT